MMHVLVYAFHRLPSVAIMMDTAACLKRTSGRPPTVAVTLQCPQQHPPTESTGRTTTINNNSNNNSSSISSVETWFRAASSFWSPLVLRVVRDTTSAPWPPQHNNSNNNSSSNNPDPDEVVVRQWIVQGGTATARYAVLQNLDHEQRIVWTIDDKHKT